MVFSRNLSADRQPQEAFRSQFPRAKSEKQSGTDYVLPLHIIEWSHNEPSGSESSGLKPIAELESQDSAAIRIVFAPQDVPHPATIDGMCELFDRQRIPSAFIAEGLQGVSQSFSVQKDAESTYVWFHFLCKDVAVSGGKIVHDTVLREGGASARGQRSAQNHSQANFNWIKTGFVMRVRHRAQPSSPPLPSRTMTSSSGSTLISSSVRPEVELFCFGAPTTIRDRFQKLMEAASCEEILEDPYILLEAVIHELYKVLDRSGWIVADIFGKIEEHTMELASTPGKAAKERLDFAGLHYLAKHTIYLRENCESGLATLDGLRDHHKSTMADQSSPAQAFTKQSLKYQKTLFQSTQRRLTSLDTRIANIIQLSFHVVTQGDSRLMQSENQSMKTIAVTTLVFMPLSTVAGIFGTQFMKLDEEPGHHVTVSRDFWLLWVIAVPLTFIVIVLWRVWYADAKLRLSDEIPRDTKRFMGWRTLRWSAHGKKVEKQEEFPLVTRSVPPDERRYAA
ncbi:hypothetical protein FB567DRAFT_492553 [Paraphoma chrysanthemicola]|uniref:Uncharacterized protein n=1 Tax=Paraphoma chrysanthemicola TaxID=798071 RepID=A0A8K0R9L5_9PLEO|nr:hypothetical protein FB567DRAFT_492553 [Paraphoma chrysanthemicola]